MSSNVVLWTAWKGWLTSQEKNSKKASNVSRWSRKTWTMPQPKYEVFNLSIDHLCWKSGKGGMSLEITSASRAWRSSSPVVWQMITQNLGASIMLCNKCLHGISFCFLDKVAKWDQNYELSLLLCPGVLLLVSSCYFDALLTGPTMSWLRTVRLFGRSNEFKSSLRLVPSDLMSSALHPSPRPPHWWHSSPQSPKKKHKEWDCQQGPSYRQQNLRWERGIQMCKMCCLLSGEAWLPKVYLASDLLNAFYPLTWSQDHGSPLPSFCSDWLQQAASTLYLFINSCRGLPKVSVLQATKSAANPGAIFPMSSRPRFFAPPCMAKVRTSRAVIAARELLMRMQQLNQWPWWGLGEVISTHRSVLKHSTSFASEVKGERKYKAPLMSWVERWRNMASLASPSMLPVSLLDVPSTPSPQFTPSFKYLRTGAIPEASLILEEGQWARPILLLANNLDSLSSSMQQWANQTSSLSQPTSL